MDRKIRNRFYVASSGVIAHAEQGQDSHCCTMPSRWTKKTLKEAIAHAEQILDSDPKRDHVAVVQIIRMVRRGKTPNVIEVIK